MKVESQMIRVTYALKWIRFAAIGAILAVAVCSADSPAWANIYFVDNTTPAASDKADGISRSHPWKTLQHAVDAAKPGDSIYVRGDYEEAVTIAKQGTAQRWITLQNAPGSRPKVIGQRTSEGYGGTYGHGIHLKQCRYMRVVGFDVTVPRDKVSNGVGIGFDDCDHIELTRNTVHGCGQSGIGGVGSDYVRILNNVVSDNSWSGFWQGSGISLYQMLDKGAAPKSPAEYHNVISGNICFGNRNDVAGSYGKTDGNGIIIDDGNQTQRSAGHPLKDQKQLAGYRVENNVCYGNGGRGIHVFYSCNVLIVNNTCYDNGRVLKKIGEFSVVRSENIVLRNNIAYAGQGCLGMLVAEVTNTAWDHNLYYGGIIADWNGVQAARGPGDLVADPRFRNPAAFDFTLRAGSPAIDRGSATGAPQRDRNGIRRPQRKGIDMGAYEARPE